MTDAKSATRKPKRPFALLPSALAQLVEDRFDEEQYDQAVDLLAQLRVEGIAPPKSLIQKLVALSLCSLAPGQVASTSRWTLDHELHDIAARLLTHPKSSKGDRNVMKAASSASDKPSASSILKASSLLVQYSQVSADNTCEGGGAPGGRYHERGLLARHILESFPSRRKPRESTRSVSSEPSSKACRDSARLDDDDDRDESSGLSSIERWVRNSLQHAEDVWDLLCDCRFSHPTELENVSLARVSQFWMNDSERRRYQKHLQSARTSHHGLDDRLEEIRWRRLNGAQGSDPSDTDSDDTTDDDDDLRLKAPQPGRAAKRLVKPKGSGKKTKRTRTLQSEASLRDDDKAHHSKVRMTEGAWRTLSALLRLWEQSIPHQVTSNAESTTALDNEPALLWQFPRSHSARQSGRFASNTDPTDEIGRALDVAFSFPSVLPAYIPLSTGTEATTNLFGTAKSLHTPGDARYLSSVSEAELAHRRGVSDQKEKGLVALRAADAAWLLSSMYRLVKLNHISPVALIEGVAERIKALQGHEIQYLMLPLLAHEPFVVASALAAHLRDASRTRPDKARPPVPVRFTFEGRGVVTMDANSAYAMPREEKALAILKNGSIRQQDSDAKAILHFLALNKLELDESADRMMFPSRLESREQPVVRQQSRRQDIPNAASRKTIKKPSPEVEAPLTEEITKGGLVTLAFVRLMQMQERDRINQVKFYIARALTTMSDDDEATRRRQASNAVDYKGPKEQISNGDHIKEFDPASQRRHLELHLTRLYKALGTEFSDFQRCVNAMKTHLGKESTQRRHKHPAGLLGADGSRDRLAGLPPFETVVKRCSDCLDTTYELVFSTRMLIDSLKAGWRYATFQD